MKIAIAGKQKGAKSGAGGGQNMTPTNTPLLRVL
jgi:hypothetical protein